MGELRNNKVLWYKGVNYPSTAALSRATNVSEATLKWRLNRGWSVEDAVEREPTDSPRAKEVVYLGETYPSHKAFCSSMGFVYTTFIQTLSKNETIEDAVNAYLADKKGRRPVTLWGKEYSSITELADAYGVDPMRLYHHMNNKGKSPEECMRVLLNGGITFKGKKYATLTELCSDYKILNSTVFGRMTKGWTLERALTTPLDRSALNTNAVSVVYRGVSYYSKSELLRQYGVGVSIVNCFLKENALTSSDWLFAFDIIASFLETCKGNRTNIVTKVPLVIYNGQWLYTAAEFCQACNIPVVHYRSGHIKNKHSIPSMLMWSLKSETDQKYLINGQYYGYNDVVKVFKTSPDRALRKGLGVKIDVLRHPECTYNPNGYCRDAYNDYIKYRTYRLQNR